MSPECYVGHMGSNPGAPAWEVVWETVRCWELGVEHSKWQVGLRSKDGILTGTVADEGSTPRREPISREATSPRSEED